MTARRTFAALLVATALSAAAVSAGLDAQPAAAATPTASVVVAPDGGGILRSGKAIGVGVTVHNTGTTALPAGRLTISLDAGPVASTSELTSSITTPPEALQGVLSHATAAVPALAEDAERTVRTTISKKDLTDLLTSASGARRLYVQYRAGSGAEVAQKIAVSSLVKVASGEKGSVALGTVIPLLAPPTATGVVDVAMQQQLTAPDGAWSRALRAAQADPAAAIALDPAVIASIRIAGSTAPPEVTGFLDQLGGLPNEFLRLPYADTDVTLARAAGSRRSLEPSSFAGVTLAATAQGVTPAPTATAGSTPAAAADLTTWNWSERKIAWPVPRTASAADLARFAAAGDQVLLSSDDLKDTAARRESGALARIGTAGVLVSDATVSSLLASASAGGPVGDAALATLTGLLATAAVSGETSAVLATVGRTGAPAGLDRVLGLLGRQAWIHSASLTDLGSVGDAAQVGLKPGSEPKPLVATARSLLDGEEGVQQLGKAIVADADTVTAPQRLALLGTLSAAWRGDDTGWRTASGTAQKGFEKVLGEVQLAKQSSPNLAGGDGTLLVYVVNLLPTPVKAVVHAGVSNGAVQFTSPSVTVTVPAGGRARADMGFRSIRNGRTDLTLSLSTPDGTAIGTAVTRGATVRAGFDTLVAIGLLIALGLLLALGVYRNVKRRRQPRAVAA